MIRQLLHYLKIIMFKKNVCCFFSYSQFYPNVLRAQRKRLHAKAQFFSECRAKSPTEILLSMCEYRTKKIVLIMYLEYSAFLCIHYDIWLNRLPCNYAPRIPVIRYHKRLSLSMMQLQISPPASVIGTHDHQPCTAFRRPQRISLNFIS